MRLPFAYVLALARASRFFRPARARDLHGRRGEPRRDLRAHRAPRHDARQGPARPRPATRSPAELRRPRSHRAQRRAGRAGDPGRPARDLRGAPGAAPHPPRDALRCGRRHLRDHHLRHQGWAARRRPRPPHPRSRLPGRCRGGGHAARHHPDRPRRPPRRDGDPRPLPAPRLRPAGRAALQGHPARHPQRAPGCRGRGRAALLPRGRARHPLRRAHRRRRELRRHRAPHRRRAAPRPAARPRSRPRQAGEERAPRAGRPDQGGGGRDARRRPRRRPGTPRPTCGGPKPPARRSRAWRRAWTSCGRARRRPRRRRRTWPAGRRRWPGKPSGRPTSWATRAPPSIRR